MNLKIILNDADPYDGPTIIEYKNIKTYWWDSNFVTVNFYDGSRRHIATSSVAKILRDVK